MSVTVGAWRVRPIVGCVWDATTVFKVGSPWLSSDAHALVRAVAVVVVASERSTPGLWSSTLVRESMTPNAVVADLVASTSLVSALLTRDRLALDPLSDTLASLLLDACVEDGPPLDALSCVRQAWLRPGVVQTAFALHQQARAPRPVSVTSREEKSAPVTPSTRVQGR